MTLKPEKRRGIIAVLVAVSLVAILGIAAIAIDGGLLLDNRRRVQAAADAAALAAASDLFANWAQYQGFDNPGTAKTSALSTAAANGYSNDGSTSVVTINLAPKTYADGPHVGTSLPAGYAEVIIQYNQPRGFSRIFASADLPVKARAVARGKRLPSGIGVLLLNPSQQGSLALSGSAGIRVDGSVIVNSAHSSAAVSSGSAGLTSSEMDITGNFTSSGSSYFHANPLNTGQPATADFLADLPVPDPSTMITRSTSTYSPTSGEVMQPGRYIGGIQISSQPNITFAPGIYYLEGGGLAMSGTSSLTAIGVMIYNGPASDGKTGKIALSGGSTVVQSPPTSGPYYGISVFQQRSSTQTVALSGGSGWNFTGTVYAASAQVDLSGSSGGTMGSQFVADTMTLSGSSTFSDIDPSKGFARRDIRLVE